jgi:hypothetical protein
MRTRDYEFDYGRIADERLPREWSRSKKDNLVRRCSYGRICIYLYPRTSYHAGRYGIMYVLKEPGAEPTFMNEQFDTEREALDRARDIIYDAGLEDW